MKGLSEAQILALAPRSPSKRWPAWANVALALSALVVLAVLIWQGVSAQGVPDPTKEQASSFSAFLNIGVLVFR